MPECSRHLIAATIVGQRQSRTCHLRQELSAATEATSSSQSVAATEATNSNQSAAAAAAAAAASRSSGGTRGTSTGYRAKRGDGSACELFFGGEIVVKTGSQREVYLLTARERGITHLPMSELSPCRTRCCRILRGGSHSQPTHSPT